VNKVLLDDELELLDETDELEELVEIEDEELELVETELLELEVLTDELELEVETELLEDELVETDDEEELVLTELEDEEVLTEELEEELVEIELLELEVETELEEDEVLTDDLDDENTNKSIYNIRIGTQQRLTWVDKEKFDEFQVGVAYTTLASILNVSDATMTLTDSSDFEDTGTVTIGAYTYDYTANNTTTGVLTLTSVVPASENQAAGADVFQGATQGLPQYWTTYGGYIYFNPITSSDYDGKNIYMDYYIKQISITTDAETIIIPDPTVVINYLCWKFLKKLANGEETPGSQSYMNNYLTRREKMKQKETLGTTFKMRPRVQNFANRSGLNDGTPRNIRDASFPNTGF